MVNAAPEFPWFVLWALVIGLVPGLLLAVAGWRGRRLDDHPVCRDCEFDLFGTPRDHPEKPVKCPECGTRREPRVGNRRRSYRLMSAGTVIAVASVGTVIVWGSGRYTASQLAAVKPVWLLKWEAVHAGDGGAAIALGELTDRVTQKSLPASTAEGLVDLALTRGPAGDPALVHVPRGNEWDKLAVTLMRSGLGTDDQRAALGRSFVETWTEVRPRVRVGEPVPVRLRQRALGGFVSLGQVGLQLEIHEPGAVFDVERHVLGISDRRGVAGIRGSGLSGGWLGTTLRPGYGLPRGLGLGEHTFELEQSFSLTDGSGGAVLAEWGQRETLRFTYVDAGGDPVRLVRDPTVGAEIEQNLSVRTGRVSEGLLLEHGRLRGMLDLARVPHDLAYRVEIDFAGRRWPGNNVTVNRVPHGHSVGLNFDDPPPTLSDGDTVDLVFTPDPDAARMTTDMTAILDHAFTIRGVRVEAAP
ncbi:MAG: hypothetical protein AAF800_02640 [Planctomycetota bacterium]